MRIDHKARFVSKIPKVKKGVEKNLLLGNSKCVSAKNQNRSIGNVRKFEGKMQRLTESFISGATHIETFCFCWK